MAVTNDGLSQETGQNPDLGYAWSRNPEARMPLMEHIRELRNRFTKIAIVLVVGSIIGWVVYPHVWGFIERPYCRIPQPADAFAGRGCHLFVTGLFDALFLRLQISIITGVLLSSPVWLYQLWAFIAPGLYKRERRWAYYFVGAAVPLFAIGAAISYFAMSRGLHFLLDMVPHNTTAIITISTYLSYAEAMLLIFGIAFEVPLAFVLLNLAGVLTHERFRKWRRSIIFLVFVFAAVATPSPDPISMLLLAVPCVALVEATEIFAWAHDRRKAARLGSLEFPGLSEEEVAEYGLDKPLGEPTETERTR
ncbi:MAG TPA: twin-arginine translocase subunit TatC [Streptosporangiaceae bacterium]|jgi:sec-independent protein translocase protein TatC